MDVRQIVDLVKQTPGIQQAVDIIEAQLERAPIMPEDLDEIISMLEAVVEDPNRYPEVRAAAIQDGVVREEEAPPEYDPTFVLSVLIALYGYRDRLSQQGYARGGLKVGGRLAAAGRGGDSMLAHINPREAEMLERMGGSGTINPNTGLREYKSGKGLLGAILPIALNFIAPGLGAAIGGALGATGTAATVLGSAVIGGASAALTGGDPLKGAVMGGLGGGLGSVVGGATSNALGLGLGQTGQSLLGGALVGGAAGALSGEGFGKGALMGTAGAGLGIVSQGAGTGAFGQGLGAAGQTAGNMLTAGYKPKEAILGGGLAGLASGLTYKPPTSSSGLQLRPSDAVVEGLKKPPMTDAVTGNIRLNKSTGKMEYSPTLDVDYSFASKNQPAPLLSDGVVSSFTGLRLSDGPSSGLQLPTDTSAFGPITTATPISAPSSLSLKDVGTLALVSQLAGQRPPGVNEAIQKMSPEQQEYFNRPSVQWDWNKLQSDANAQNMGLSEYMATYWPQVTSGAYNAPAAMAMGGAYAGGGAMGAVARLVRGGGSGRDDTINARLSDGEYVMDAETVAMLGDGSTDAGARRLDSMRAQLRKHKGKTLAKGKFSPNAKSPLAYLKGAA